MNRLRAFLEIAKVIGIVFICAILVRIFVFQPYIVDGASMEPDFNNGEYLLIEKIKYRFSQPERGEVIVFKYPDNPTVSYIKRIIALPGDKIRIEEGNVYINGALESGGYLSDGEKTYVDGNPEMVYETTLEKDQYFVLGDNRSHSSDSREWGPLNKKFIIGKMALVLYPNSKVSASPN